MELGELEAMVRRVMSEELRPVQKTLAQLAPSATVPNPASSAPVTLMRHRRQQKRGC
jgi:hypothetical protein